MPFKSKAQQRFMFAAEARGELPKGKALEWAHETKNIKKLPEHKMNKTAEQIADALIEKLAMPRWEQMARKTPGLLEGAHPDLGHMRKILEAKNEVNAAKFVTPKEQHKEVSKKLLDVQHPTPKTTEWSDTGRKYYKEKSGLGLNRFYHYPTLGKGGGTQINDLANPSHHAMQLEYQGLKPELYEGATRGDVLKSILKRDKPITPEFDDWKASYKEQQLLDKLHKAFPKRTTPLPG